jgi:hypothetical protein
LLLKNSRKSFWIKGLVGKAQVLRDTALCWLWEPLVHHRAPTALLETSVSPKNTIFMKNRQIAGVPARFVALFFVAFSVNGAVLAQDTIYRCPGNEYTNNAKDAVSRGCKPVEGGNITIVQNQRPAAAPAPRAAAPREGSAGGSSATPTARASESAEQRARDSDALVILRAELRKTEERLAELNREFNNGDVEKRGEEFRNNQKYLDRVADLKAAILRAQSDVNGLKREIDRAGGGSSSGPQPQGPVSAGTGR